MINEQKVELGLTVSPRRLRSILMLGQETGIGPRTPIQILLTATSNDVVPEFVAEPMSGAGAEDAVLQQVAARTAERAREYPRSGEAALQAGFSALAAEQRESAMRWFGLAKSLAADVGQLALGVARLHFESGDTEQAATVLDDAIELRPEDAPLRVGRAVLHASGHRWDSALGVIEQAPQVVRESAIALATSGMLHLAASREREAIGLLRKAVRLRPEWQQARTALGLAELRKGNQEAAERRFKEAQRAAPFGEVPTENLMRKLLGEQRFEEVVKFAETELSIERAGEGLSRVVGLAALNAERWGMAVEWLARSLEQTSAVEVKARLLNDLGVAEANRNSVKVAAEFFVQSYRLVPRELALVNAARALLATAQPLAAIELLREAANLLPQVTVEVPRLLARALGDSRRYREAVDVGKAALARPDADGDLAAYVSYLLVDFLNDPLEAIAILRSAITRFGRDSQLRNNLAYSLVQAGRLDDAGAELADGFDSGDSMAPAILATRGLLEIARGNISGGREQYNEAIRIARTEALRERIRVKRDLEVGRALAAGRVTLGREARELLERASRGGPSSDPYPEHARRLLGR